MNNKPSGLSHLNNLIWGLLTASGVVVCLATLFGFLGKYSWFLDLFSHFRVQYLISLTILSTLLFLSRRRRTAIAFLGFALVNLVLILPLYFGGQNTAPEDSTIIRAMFLNVSTQFGDSERVKEVVQDLNPDIIVLEEINSQWVENLAWLSNSHPYTLVQMREDNFGIGLFSKLPLVESEVAYIGGIGAPSLLITVNTGITNLRVIATHTLPPTGAIYSRWRNKQLDQLSDFTKSSLPILLLGDLNTTPWSYYFKKLLKNTGLSNSSRGYGVQPTWPSFAPIFSIPIDHALHSSDIVIVDRKIGPDVSSDHFPVIIDFTILTEAKNITQ